MGGLQSPPRRSAAYSGRYPETRPRKLFLFVREDLLMTCIQCGWCCRAVQGFSLGEGPDLLRWHREGRRDILQYVAAGRNPDGTVRTAADLGQRTCRYGSATGWTDPLPGASWKPALSS